MTMKFEEGAPAEVKKKKHVDPVWMRVPKPGASPELTNDKMKLARRIERSLAKGFTEVEACYRAGITTEDYIKLRAANPEMQTNYQRALDDQTQWYEKVARKRAVKGYTETTKDSKGNIIKTVHKFDSDMLIKMLAARDKRYRTAVKATDVSVNFDFAGTLEAARQRVKKLKKAN